MKISTSRRAHAIIVLSTIGPQLEIVGIDEVVLQVAGEVELKDILEIDAKPSNRARARARGRTSNMEIRSASC
jgi:hypothetical protein